MEVKPIHKQTDLAVICKEWEVKQLGDLGTVVRGGSPRPAGNPRYFNGDFIPWLTVGSLTNIPTHQLFVTGTATKLTQEGAKHSRTLQNGTLVIVNSGAKTLGVAKILAITCCANDGIAALVNQRSGEKRFLCYFLNSQIQRLREVVAAGNDQLNLNTGRIALIAVPFPEQSEQLAIADTLSDVDALLGALDRLIAKKRDIKQAAMQQLLTGQTRLPDFTGEWEVKRLDELADIVMGQSPDSRYYNRTGKGVPLIQGNADIVDGRSFARVWTSKVSKEGLADDLLLTVRAPVGAIGRATERSCLGRGVCALRPRCNREFLFHALRFSEASWKVLEQGSTFTAANSAQVAAFSIRLPNLLAEQAAIATLLSDMDAELVKLGQQLAKTRDIKQGMMQELLTGKTRLLSLQVSHA